MPLSLPGSTDRAVAAALSTRGTGRITGFWARSRVREAGLGFSLPQEDDLCKPKEGLFPETQIGVRVLEGLAATPAPAVPWSLSRRADEADIWGCLFRKQNRINLFEYVMGFLRVRR